MKLNWRLFALLRRLHTRQITSVPLLHRNVCFKRVPLLLRNVCFKLLHRNMCFERVCTEDQAILDAKRKIATFPPLRKSVCFQRFCVYGCACLIDIYVHFYRHVHEYVMCDAVSALAIFRYVCMYVCTVISRNLCSSCNSCLCYGVIY